MIMMKYGWMGFLKIANFGMGKFIDMIEMGFFNEFLFIKRENTIPRDNCNPLKFLI